MRDLPKFSYGFMLLLYYLLLYTYIYYGFNLKFHSSLSAQNNIAFTILYPSVLLLDIRY